MNVQIVAQMKSSYFYWLLLALLTAGCQKDTAVQVDLSAPVIDIVEPLPGAEMSPGKEVRIFINIEENQELHDYSVVIRNADLTFNKTIAGGHLHARQHQIDELFLVPEFTNQVYTITVKASDHNDNLGAKQIELFVP